MMIKLRGVEGWQKADEQTTALNLKDLRKVLVVRIPFFFFPTV